MLRSIEPATNIIHYRFCILFIVVTWASWFAQQYENKRRDKLALTDPNYATGEGNTDLTSGYRDLTDRENLVSTLYTMSPSLAVPFSDARDDVAFPIQWLSLRGFGPNLGHSLNFRERLQHGHAARLQIASSAFRSTTKQRWDERR